MAVTTLVAVVDSLLGFLAESYAGGLLPAALFGVIGAQVGCHAIWCALAPSPVGIRLGIGIAAGLGWYGAFLAGAAAYHDGPDFEEVLVRGLLCLPLILLAIQSPLWLARCFLRWRIQHRRDPARRLPPESTGIRDILLATGVVAAALSAARMGIMVIYRDSRPSWFSLGLYALLAAGISLLTVLPVVVATLRARRLWLALPSLLVPVFGIAAGFVVGVSGIEGPWPPPLEVYYFSALMGGCFLICLTGPLVDMRRLGYRLYWGRR